MKRLAPLATSPRVKRLAPLIVLAASLLAGGILVFGAHAGGRPRPRFVAYRGPHRVGDLIGPNARVVAIDGRGDPTAVVSTDGHPPVVWAFELADDSTLAPLGGRRVHTLDRRLWARPACPSALCPAGPPGPHVAPPPPTLPLDPCPAIRLDDLTARWGRARISATSPLPGVCVWDNGRTGVAVEVGGPGWWPYLTGLHGLYRAVDDHTLVDADHGLHLAVHHGTVTAVLLTFGRTSAATWQPIAEEAAAWAASR